MFTITDCLKGIRNEFFETLGKKRWMRIITIAFSIALVWDFADWISGSYAPNLWHALICLALAAVIERLLPWGK